MKSNVKFTRFVSKFLLMCILLHLSSALPWAKLFAAPPPKNPDAEAKVASTSNSAAAKAVSLPLFFEANQGQTDPPVRFLTRSAGYTLFLTPTETVLAESKTRIGKGGGWDGGIPKVTKTAGSFVRMQLVGANSSPVMTGMNELPGKVNYLIGSDRADWHTGVPLFSKVRSEQVYPGVDLLFHGDDKQLEYDFIVAPGADPSKIAFRIRGTDRIEIDSQGDLILHTSDSDFRMHKPLIYQMVGDERHLVEGNFIRKGKHEVAFQIGPYDHSQTLVIDPVIAFASFLGGDGIELAFGAAVDDSTPSAPRFYLAGGTTDSQTFPETSTTIFSGTSTTPVVSEVGFLAKIDPTASGSASLVYLTFVGGKTPFQSADAGCDSSFNFLALDKSQGPANLQPVAGGFTTCKDFPFTVTLQAETGTTGNDQASLATRLSPSGAAIDQAALLGGNQSVNTGFVSVNGVGNILLSGSTQANNLPVVNPYISAFNNGAGGVIDCYAALLERSDLKITYATYLNAGQGDTTNSHTGCGAFEDSSGNILAGGNTVSPAVFNVGAGGTNLANGFQTTYCQGGVASCPSTTTDVFIMKLNPTLVGVNQLLFGSYYGGGGDTRATNGAFDLGKGVVAIVGGTTSGTSITPPNIPLQNAFQSTNKGPSGGRTGFLFLTNTTQTAANSLLCSTYIGGSSGNDIVGAVSEDAADPTAFRIVLGGGTASNDFPVLNELEGFQQPVVGAVDSFVSVLKVPQPNQAPFNASLYFSTYVGSGTPTTIGGQNIDFERLTGLAVDSNHTIYAAGYALSSNYFAKTTPATIGFQNSCTSCAATPPIGDVVVFTLKTGGSATLSSITVTPSSSTIGQGQTQQFAATGFYNDGTILDITNTATWASTVTTIATISNSAGTQGLATASSTNAGQTQITAAQGGVTSAAATLTVSAPVNISVDLLNNATSGVGTVVDNLIPPEINCTTAQIGTPTGSCGPVTYPAGATVTFTETPGAGSAFTGWANYPCQSGTGGTTSTCAITASTSGTLFANFANGTAGPFTLMTALPANTSASTGGGRVGVGVTGGGISCTFNATAAPTGTCSVATEKDGQIVELIPQADSNSNFGGWAGTCPFEVTGPPDQCYVTMSKNQTVTPVFTIVPITLKVTLTGNGTVTSNTGGINCTNPPPASGNVCSGEFNSGSSVILTATPGTGYSPSTPLWTTACNVGTSGNTCSLLLTAGSVPSGSFTANASFTINSYLLNVSTTGGSGTGTVTSNANNLGGTIDCGPGLPVSGCGLEELFNATVTLMETPSTNNTFSGWAASGVSGFALPASCNGTPTTCTFNMPVVPAGSTFTVTATFTSSPTGAALAITKTASPNPVAVGGTLNYTITVKNNGPAAATGVVMTDPVPENLLPNMVVASETCTELFNVGSGQTTLSCAIGSMANGASTTITYNVVPTTAGPITNTAMVTGTNNTNSTNNSASVTTTVGLVTPVTLGVILSGTNGTVADTVNPTLIHCSITNQQVTGTCSAPYNPGTSVSLLATGGTGSTLSSWTAGPCNGASTNPCAFTITTNTNVAATFKAIATAPALSIAKSHTGNFTQGQVGAQYTVTVSNAPGAAPTTGTVTVTDTIPSGLTLASMSGTGWTCGAPTNAANVCTRADALAAGASYPNITVTVDVAANATSPQVNSVSASGGGSATANTSDSTVIALGPALSITKSHSGDFTQGQQGAQYSLTVANSPSAGPSGGTTAQPHSTTVQSTGSIYDTGGGSTAPTMFTLPSGATSVVFTSVTGSITTGCASTEGCIVLNNGTGNNANDPDGVGAATATSLNTGTTSISGITGPGAGYLVGVFVPAGGPAGTAPAALDFTSSGLGTSFTSLSPQLDQVFFIGDGLTGNGVGNLQTFNIPTGAAQLWLGISDAPFYNGAPGSYGDNLGAYAVGFTVNTPGSGVAVTETAPSGLTLVSMAGTGWNCGSPNPANVCTRSDVLGADEAYPVITVTVNVAANATSPQVNTASVTGGGSAPANASDSTVIVSAAAPALAITKTHTGNFTQGQQGATYTVTVANGATAGPTSGTVTVTDTIPSGLTLVSMAGAGWTCGTPNPPNVCTRTDVVGGDSSYPPITVTVNVAASATSPQVNAVNVAGGGSATANATDSTVIVTTAAPALAITKSHTGNFTQGQQGAQYTVAVSNAKGAGSTSGTVTVTDTIPSGLTLVSMAGTGWTCGALANPANVCTRTDALAGGNPYPSITVTVNVTANAASPQVNSVTVSGGGSASATANDSTTITAVTLVSIAVTPANQTILTGQTLQYTATGTYSDNSTKDITTQVTWASSNTLAATISNTAGSQGLATAASSLTAAATKSRAMATPAGTPVTQATTTISATLGETQGTTGLTVTSSPVIITVAPPPPGQPAVPVIDPGGAAVYGLVLTSQPGFSGTVTLGCTSSSPQFITCTPDPASVNITPGGTTQVAIVLNTFCSRNAPLDMPVPGGPAGVLIVVLTALALASVTWMYRRRPRWVLTFAALTIAVYSIVGCGSTPTGPAGRTPAGQYTLNLSFKVNGGAAIPGPQLQLIVK